MAWSRTATALVGLAASLAVSVVGWVVFDTFVLFLFVPFIPLLLRRGAEEQPPLRTCPECGFSTRDPSFEHCPRDGTRLQKRGEPTAQSSRSR